MTFSKYFSHNISNSAEILASVIVRSNWNLVDELVVLVPDNERPRFKILLAALREIPVELQKKLAEMVMVQNISSTGKSVKG